MSTADELAKLVALRDQGDLTPAEFDDAKARLLSTQAPSSTSPTQVNPPPAEATPPPPPGPPSGPPEPPTGPLPPPPRREDEDERRKKGAFFLTRRGALIGLVVLVVIGAGVALGIGLGGGGKPAAASEVFLQPRNGTGPHPFTANVGTNATTNTRKATAVLTTTGSTNPRGAIVSYTGNTVGLYGGTLSTSSCNPQQMISYLRANPDKAQAWATAQGVPVSQLASYISSLTPMTLRYDTRVTNHGFSNGSAYPIPEVLEAGQAVLVDQYGVPRARCYCGNPLTPPAATSTTGYTGPPWPGFSPSTVVVVQQSTTIINNFTIIDNTTGQPFNRPTGTTGSSDGPPQTPPGTPSMPGVSPGGSRSTTTTAPRGPTTTLPLTPATTAPPATSPPATTPAATPPVTAAGGQQLGSGPLQVTLVWGSTADLDLHVVEPGGTEINYQNRTAADGGTLDVDANSGCGNATTSPVENVFWSNPPAAGTYTVNLVYFKQCGNDTGPQNYTIYIRQNGQVVQQQSGTITFDPNQMPQTALTFNVS